MLQLLKETLFGVRVKGEPVDYARKQTFRTYTPSEVVQYNSWMKQVYRFNKRRSKARI